MSDRPRRGAIYAARLGPVEGSEQAGSRPVVVVSNDLFNEVMPIVTIVPVTTLRRGRRTYPSEVRLNKGTAGLRADSLALCHQVRTIATSRLGRRIGSVPDAELGLVADALRTHLSL
ncbi:MAG TPA: type II toxin-antitoxin system PemK/MazF family toxin [Actinomycetota bacterium]